MAFLAGSAVLSMTLLLAGKASGFGDTSSTEYCLSCHEMKRYDKELKASSHAKDANKKEIGCGQCHIPESGLRWLAVKAIFGVKDIAKHTFGDVSDLDRLELQHFTRRFVPDENCLACHKDLMKSVKGEPIGEVGKQAHEAYLGKNGNTASNCAGCHQNMGHLPTFDAKYEVNAKFAARLAAKEDTP